MSGGNDQTDHLFGGYGPPILPDLAPPPFGLNPDALGGQSMLGGQAPTSVLAPDFPSGPSHFIPTGGEPEPFVPPAMEERIPVAAAPPPAMPAPRPAPAPKPKKANSGRGGRGGVITMRVLLEEGILEPGVDVLSVEYKGMSHTANLAEDGRIVLNIKGKQMVFESPSAFSIYLKRLVNPTRKADDGWKTVKYKGRLLEQFKGEFLRKKMGDDFGDPLEPPGKRLRSGVVDTTTGSTHNLTSLENFASFHGVPLVDEEEEKFERPRRQRKAPPRFAALGVDDEHALQPLEAFGPGEQPFTLRVSPAAEAVMDFHAHLNTNEVIGIMAGTWDPVTKVITVMRAFPVEELSTEDDSINVEMDPESEVAAREEITTKLGMKVVGWYHSHPFFPTQPSRIDIYNQVLQQHAHRETDTGTEPYVAAIVGPYDKRNSTAVSSLTWFYVDHKSGAVPSVGQRPEEVGCVAKQLQVETIEDDKYLENLTPLQRDLENLAKRYAPNPDRAHLEGRWKDNMSRIDKLVASVQSRLPAGIVGDVKLKSFGSKVYVSTRAVWNVYGAKAEAAAGSALPAVPSAGNLAGGAGGSVGGNVTEGSENPPHDGDDEPISDDEED